MTAFETPEVLDDYLQDLNDQGQEATIALIDRRGILWLTYGEEVSGGGEWMTCWLVDGDPWDTAKDDAGPVCEDCGKASRRIPLTSANYPVRLLSTEDPDDETDSSRHQLSLTTGSDPEASPAKPVTSAPAQPAHPGEGGPMTGETGPVKVRQQGRKQIDLASVALLVCGLVFGVVAYRLITEQGLNPLILGPSVVAVTIGVTHLVKRQAPRDRH